MAYLKLSLGALKGRTISSDNPVIYQKSDHRPGVVSFFRRSQEYFDKLHTVTAASHRIHLLLALYLVPNLQSQVRFPFSRWNPCFQASSLPAGPLYSAPGQGGGHGACGDLSLEEQDLDENSAPNPLQLPPLKQMNKPTSQSKPPRGITVRLVE